MKNNIKKYKYKYFDYIHLDDVYNLEVLIFGTDAWSKNDFLAEIARVKKSNIVALSEDIPIGYIFTSILYENCHINNLAVDYNFRGKNIAYNLIKNILNICKSKNVKNITLEVRSSNFQAISLYEKFGFQSVHVRKLFYKNPIEDALLMLLELTP